MAWEGLDSPKKCLALMAMAVSIVTMRCGFRKNKTFTEVEIMAREGLVSPKKCLAPMALNVLVFSE